MADHALLIGTTGMLAKAAREIVGESQHVTLCARGASDFTFGESFLDNKIIRLPLDYSDEDHFIDTLHIRGPVDLAMTWIRPEAHGFRNAIANCVMPGGKIVEIMGSTAGQSGGFADQRMDEMKQFPGRTYRQLILGFVIEDDTSRWLNHDEISAAALQALRGFETRTIAGTLGPWSNRP